MKRTIDILKEQQLAQNGLLQQLDAYCDAVEQKVAKWFSVDKHPSFSQLKKSMKKFEGNYVSQNCEPLHYIL